MRRFLKAATIVILLMVPFFFGCAGSAQKELAGHPSLVDLNYKTGTCIKKAAVVLGEAPETAIGRQVGELYLQTLIRTIQKHNQRVHLITEKDNGFPGYLQDLAEPSPAHDISRLAKLSRAQGFQGLLRLAVLEIQTKTKRTGILWFRKTRYSVAVSLALDLYDPFTDAKMLSMVRQKVIKISFDDFEAFKQKSFADLDALNEVVVDEAEDLGERVANTFKSQPWKVPVANVQDGRIYLAAGRQTGLKIGDRLAVFQARRIIAGPGGEKFIVPSHQVAEIRITAFKDQMSEAAADVQADIQEGDFAIPVN